MNFVRHGELDEFVSEEEALALAKIYMEDWVLLYEATIMEAVRNKTLRQRMVIYEFSYKVCARQGG